MVLDLIEGRLADIHQRLARQVLYSLILLIACLRSQMGIDPLNQLCEQCDERVLHFG